MHNMVPWAGQEINISAILHAHEVQQEIKMIGRVPNFMRDSRPMISKGKVVVSTINMLSC